MLTKQVQSFDCEPRNIPSRKNEKSMLDWTKAVKSVSQDYNRRMIEFTSSVVKNAMEICREAPCRFAVIRVGAMARGETTPYSNVKLLIMLENQALGVRDYFEKLAITIRFLTRNLGETSLRHTVIEELSEKVSLSDSESDPAVIQWFEDLSTDGYRIDWMLPTCENPSIPSLAEHPVDFIITADELVAKYTEIYQEVENYDEALKGDLSSALSSAAFIFGDEELSISFRQRIDVIESTDRRYAVIFDKMKLDCERLSLEPNEKLMRKIDLQEKIYVFSSMLTQDLRAVCGVNTCDCWDVVDQMKERGCISEIQAEQLAFLNAVGLYAKLSAHSFYSASNNICTVAPTSEYRELNGDKNIWVLPRALLLLAIFHSRPVQYYAGDSRLTERSKEKDIDSVAAEDVALALFYCNDFKSFLKTAVAEKVFQEPEKNPAVALVTIEALFEAGDRSKAENLVKNLIRAGPLKIIYRAEVYLWQGRLELGDGNFDQALAFFRRCLATSQHSTNWKAKRLEANSQSDVGTVYHSKQQYEEALKAYNQSLMIYETVHSDLGHPDIAITYRHIGDVYKSQGEYTKALECHQKSLAIRKAVHGDVNHPNIAVDYSNIGDVYKSQREYTKALECHYKSLAIRKAIHGDVNHPDIAVGYSIVGDAYKSLGEYTMALKCHQKSLAIRKAIHGDVNHNNIALNYSNVGDVYKSQGEYTKALECHQKSLAIRKAVYGEVNLYDIAVTYSNIGSVYHSQGEYAKALEFYEKSLAIRKAVHGNVNHPDIAVNYSNIGNVCYSQREYAKASVFYDKSLAIRKTGRGNVNYSGIVAKLL